MYSRNKVEQKYHEQSVAVCSSHRVSGDVGGASMWLVTDIRHLDRLRWVHRHTYTLRLMDGGKSLFVTVS